MIFGQGAIRCHPYALNEINALTNGDAKAFDKNFWAHWSCGKKQARALVKFMINFISLQVRAFMGINLLLFMPI